MGLVGDKDVVIGSAGSASAVPQTDSAITFRPKTLDELLGATLEQLADCDIALMNLLCAAGLPGAEKLDIAKCLHRLDFMAMQIGKETIRDLPKYRINPRWIYKNADPQTENAFRMSHL